MATKAKHTIKKAKNLEQSKEWTWTQVKKDRWLLSFIPAGENVAPRVMESSPDSKGKRTYFAYRNEVYLGGHATLEEAMDRCWIGERTAEHEAFITFQKEHPGIVPPGMPFTPADYHEWKRHNPTGPGSAYLGEKIEQRTKKMVEKAERATTVSDIKEDSVIRVVNDSIPRDKESAAYGRWKLIYSFNGKKVGEYLKHKDVHPGTLKTTIRFGHVRLE